VTELPQSLHVVSVSAGYGLSDIVHSATLTAESGRVTTIAGPNGAGKSTLIKVVAGLIRPRRGKILMDAQDITALAPPKRALAGLGYVPQEHNVFKNLTLEENLKIGFEFAKRKATGQKYSAARESVLSLFPDLAARLKDRAGLLSGGQRQMLAIGCALMPGPRILLLDEPSAGLSPRYVAEMLDAVRAVNETGVTVLMVEQNLIEATRISHDVILLVGGEVRGRWPAAAFLSDPLVRALFLGGSDRCSPDDPVELKNGTSAA
jgi:ABC-type branched-subunit amino acid transport system ATPase component